MNQLITEDAQGNKYLVLILEPGNIFRMTSKREPVHVRLDDFFPDGIPAKLSLDIFYSETPIADARELKKLAKVTFDERTAHSSSMKPHCPECRSNIEQLGLQRNDSPVALVFCPQCGSTLGVLASEILKAIDKEKP